MPSALERTRLGRRWAKTTWRPLAVVAASALLEALAAGLLVWLIGWQHLENAIRLRNAPWFALSLGGQVVALVGYTIAFRDVTQAAGGPKLEPPVAGALVVAGFAPAFAADVAGGFAIDRAAYEEMGMSRDEAAARVVGLGILEYLVLAPVAAVCAVLAFLGIGGNDVGAGITLPWLAIVPGLALAWWLARPRRNARLRDARGGNVLRRALAHAAAGLAVVAWIMRNDGRGRALLGVALYWTGDIVSLWAPLYAFGVHPGVPALVVAFATGYALTRRSLPAGGPGAIEILLPLSLKWVQIGFAPAFVAVFVYRLFNFWLPLVPGVLVAKRLPEIERRLPRGASSEELPVART